MSEIRDKNTGSFGAGVNMPIAAGNLLLGNLMYLTHLLMH